MLPVNPTTFDGEHVFAEQGQLHVSLSGTGSGNVTGPAAQSASNVDLLTGTVNGWYDVTQFHSGSIQIIASAGISAGAVIFEQTNDDVLAPAGAALSVIEPSGALAATQILAAAITIAANTSRLFTFPINARYIRVRISTPFVGGTVRAVGALSQLTVPNPSVYATLASSQAVVVSSSVLEDAATSAGPVIVGGVVRTAALTTPIAGDAIRATMTTGGAQIVRPHAVPELCWQFTGVLNTTTAVAARTAGATGIRNYVTDVQYQNNSATATTILILDGTTTIAQYNAPANMSLPAVISYSTPIRGAAITALNVNCGTAGASVMINVQGFQAA
jgi:hypothetical protein